MTQDVLRPDAVAAVPGGVPHGRAAVLLDADEARQGGQPAHRPVLPGTLVCSVHAHSAADRLEHHGRGQWHLVVRLQVGQFQAFPPGGVEETTLEEEPVLGREGPPRRGGGHEVVVDHM